MRENGLGVRDALNYSGCTRKMYYYKEKPRFVKPDEEVVENVKRLMLDRPSYGTRRVAAQLTRDMEVPINRKRIQRIFRIYGYVEPSKTKNDIIRAKDKAPKPSRPYELWQTDLTYVWCGIDSWGYLFNVFDVFAREWAGYQFDSTAVKDNAILSVENALAAHKGRADPRELTLRADNGPQYTSHAFKDSMNALELKLEHIAYKTPEQNGAIESFHKNLKKEYVWPCDFQNFQEAEKAIGKAYIDYNKYRIHSSLGYFTPYEFLELWFADDDHEKKEEKMLNVAA
jgi:putative transposase